MAGGVVQVHVRSPVQHIESRAFEEGDPCLRAYLQHWEEETRRRIGEGITVTVSRERSLEVRMAVKKNRPKFEPLRPPSRYAVIMDDDDEILDDED